MLIPSSMPRLKGYRFPRAIIAYAVWAYHRFALSTAYAEALLAECGVIVSRETIRLWVNRFGAHFSGCIRRVRPRPCIDSLKICSCYKGERGNEYDNGRQHQTLDGEAEDRVRH